MEYQIVFNSNYKNIMQDRIFVKTPAKINLFLRIINQRNDGYHNIRSGVTFLDLYDEMSIEVSDRQSVKYSGPFKPLSDIFENDIIIKTLDSLALAPNIKLNIDIKKNIPTQAGLGSASTNAAGLIKGLKNLGIVYKTDNKFLSNLGTDVPACLYGNDCLITGKGDKIYPLIDFPKYYFVLVKPDINFSTPTMYSKIKIYNIIDQQYNHQISNLTHIHEDDSGNDFEKIAIIENKEIKNLIDFLSKTKDCIFAGMTGSGSCCYAVFNKHEDACNALDIISSRFSDLWSYIGENISVNN